MCVYSLTHTRCDPLTRSERLIEVFADAVDWNWPGRREGGIANMKRLEQGLVKNADKRREFYLRYSRPVTLQTSTVCGVLYLVVFFFPVGACKGKKGTEGPELGQTRPHFCCLCRICPNPPLFILVYSGGSLLACKEKQRSVAKSLMSLRMTDAC